ncbi:F-box/FBD/LRR-repeat protein At1g13570-like isoform X1 [Mercurialis annua]|uniref:F-box/FBD/LRR-repeat protein At1g13570-like isoform X1 n=1 Tax=Mercurialis annua TaxID=3986 RepID=UPI002160686D|nr:F-box/FBD/LRR-repeat protein At1g13570-like isoform X1 [Mercurialis annua]
MAKRNTRPRKMSVHHSDLDRISDLPENVLEKVVMCLPIRDAVRTSILSKNWRNKWADAPQLIFDTTFTPMRQVSQTNKHLVTVYEVLLLHSGPIHKFTLSFPGLKSCPEIDRLIHFLSRKGVQDLKLCISTGNSHKLPSYLFSCLDLKYLCLSLCILTPPTKFQGFRTLIRLKLLNVQLPSNFKNFICNCWSLEELMLDDCSDISCLEISCPKLKLLYFNGSYQTLRIRNMPHLATVSIYVIDVKSEGLKVQGLLLHNLPALKYLSVDDYFLKSLVVHNALKRLPTPLEHLKTIRTFYVSFSKLEEVTSVFHLLRSSPNLQNLQIEFYSEAVEPFELLDAEELLKAEGQSDYSLNHLQGVKLQNFNGSRPEIEFVKFLLAKSPVLGKISLQPHSGISNDKKLAILEEMIQFRRTSPNAQIICEKFVAEFADVVVNM